MKKLLLAAVAASTLMGTVASATTFNIINHSAAQVGLTFTSTKAVDAAYPGPYNFTLQGSGAWGGGGEGIDRFSKIQTDNLSLAVIYAGYGKNSYGHPDDKGEYNINIWQQQPGYFAITVDKVVK